MESKNTKVNGSYDLLKYSVKEDDSYTVSYYYYDKLYDIINKNRFSYNPPVYSVQYANATDKKTAEK